MWFGRIEDEQGRGVRFLDLASALDDRTTLLGNGDDQGVVGMRRIFVRREVGAQQAEPGEMPVPPVLGRVPRIDPSHAEGYRAPQF